MNQYEPDEIHTCNVSKDRPRQIWSKRIKRCPCGFGGSNGL